MARDNAISILDIFCVILSYSTSHLGAIYTSRDRTVALMFMSICTGMERLGATSFVVETETRKICWNTSNNEFVHSLYINAK